MKLREYLFKNRISTSTLAARLGYSREYVSKVVNEKTKPSKRLKELIKINTDRDIEI